MVTFTALAMADLAGRRATKPLAFTRLEPQSISGDTQPGLEAAVHDPLWMLLRQWQFGEFLGEDNGRPLGVTVNWTTRPLATLSVAGGGVAQPIDTATLLDPAIEGGAATGTPNPRARAEAGRALLTALAEAGLDGTALIGGFPFTASDIASLPANLRPILRSSPDASLVATALESGTLPQFAAAAAPWLAWYRKGIGRPAGGSGWVQPRLEHAFSVATADGQQLSAEGHTGGTIDWWAFDIAKPAAAAAPIPDKADLLAQPLRYPGMPANRIWEFEDATVNLGGMDVGANDPARRALIEFATIYGNDWFTVPINVPRGGITTIDSLTVTDSFGANTPILPADSGKNGGFRLFHLNQTGQPDTKAGLLTVPAARLTLEGEPIEVVHLFRDETANMGWAVEERVENAAGRARFRRDEPSVVVPDPQAQIPPTPQGVPDPEYRYTLETQVPPYWIPLVAVPTDGAGGFILRKGTMTDADESRSRLLAGSGPGGSGKVDIFDEELPEGGLRIERIPRLARAADGSLLRWTAYRVRATGGSGASGLAFDRATPITAK